MKNLVVSFMLLAFGTVIGQEIKIKKDVISIDGVEVAMLDKKKTIYTFSTLDKIPKFSVEKKQTILLDGSLIYWCVITDLNTNKTKELVDYGADQGLSFQRGIVASVVNEKYKFLVPGGIDEKALSEFIEDTQLNIQKDFEDADVKTVEDLKKDLEVLIKYNIKVNKNGDIVQPQELFKGLRTVTEDVVIGKIVKENIVTVGGFPPVLTYNVNSLFKIDEGSIKEKAYTRLIATWYFSKPGYKNPITGRNIREQIITKDEKSFNVKQSLPDAIISELKVSPKTGEGDLLSKLIVAKLLANGYEFEAMKK